MWLPVSVRVRVSLGLGLRFGSVFESPLSCILYGLLCPLGLGIVLGFRDRVRVSVRLV